MSSGLTYPWIFGGAVLLLNVPLGYSRAGSLVAAGRISEEERRRFATGVALAIGGYALAATAIQVASGVDDFFCLLVFPPRAVWSMVFWTLQAAMAGALLWWVWRSDGAEVLARNGPAYTRGSAMRTTYTPAKVRLWVTVLVVLSTVGGVVDLTFFPPDVLGRACLR